MQPAFALRRQKVIDSITPGAMLLFSAPVAYRNNDVEHEYRQDSDLYYLLGFEEPESALVITTGASPRVTVFLRKRDATRETWDGPRLGVEAAAEALGVDAAYPIAEIGSRLKELLSGTEQLYYAFGVDSANDQQVLQTLRALRAEVRKGTSWPTAIIEPGKVLHEMRLFKSEVEVALLQRAMEITDAAHRRAMQVASGGIWEYELEAVLRAEFRRQGSPRVAYSPIVASGVNATILHHKSNDRQSRDGELILIDAGCELGYLATDITRTFPVSGKFTPIQRRAYEVVLSAQQEAIAAVSPGATIEAIHDKTVRILTEGLVALGVLRGDVDTIVNEGTYKKYYMHRTSHWLGMDVHDVGRYHLGGQPRPLEAGMLLTVEPGLYFPADDPAVPEGLRGCGIRIEDDVLVTKSAAQNLSASIPKTVQEIESLMSQPQRVTAGT
jgi:Xaa-Pro aminopeptidase